ncbi:MAG: hypothetical protein ABR878_18675 [Roseiarcus sp.]|jgi:hypothetical protein
MGGKTASKGKRAAEAPIIMGDIGHMTRQEIAEFIDPIEAAGSLDEAEAFAEYDFEAHRDQST